MDGQILCIFTVFVLTFPSRVTYGWADLMHIYVIPALFGHAGQALGYQIVCIFTSFPPWLAMLGKPSESRFYAYLRNSRAGNAQNELPEAS